jgi:hypothetical protein
MHVMEADGHRPGARAHRRLHGAVDQGASAEAKGLFDA